MSACSGRSAPTRPPGGGRAWLAVLFCVLLGTWATACGGDGGPRLGDADRSVWRFAIEETSGSVQDAYAQGLKALIEERSQGRIRVIVYPYGTLGTSDHVTEQLHMGTIQLATASPGHIGKLIPEVQAFLLHFVLSEDAETNHRALLDPELRRMLRELYAEKGLRYLDAFSEGWMVWTTRVPVRSPEDFSGVKMRVMTSPLLLAAYEAYGANATPLPYSEVYSGLQLRMIDGQVNPIFAIEEMSFYEVTDYLVFPNHAQFFTTVATNPEFYADLSPEDRALLDQAVEELHARIFKVQRQYNAERLDTMLERRPDLNVIRLSDAERAAFQERAQEVRELYLRMVGERGAALLDALETAVARSTD